MTTLASKQLAFASIDEDFPQLSDHPVKQNLPTNDLSSILCDHCRKDIPVDEFFGCALYHWPEMPEPNVFSTKCPFCDFLLEYKIEDGWLLFGYTYVAGRVHFADMEGVKVDGLLIVPQKDFVSITLNHRTWEVIKQRRAV